MKKEYETLKGKSVDLTMPELQNEVKDLVSKIIKTDESLLSVSKGWSGYGTWKSGGFANEFYFGKELSALILKGLNGHLTHDEEREFSVSEFEESIFDNVFEGI